MNRYSSRYQKEIIKLTPLINKIAKYVPRRRKRKLHIGLFGYSRNIEEVTLPRAITFTAALCSIGLPPDIFALDALTNDDLQFIKKVYIHFEDNLRDAIKYLNVNTGFLSDGIKAKLEDFLGDFQIDEEHKSITDYIAASLKENRVEDLREHVLRAANLRKFLG